MDIYNESGADALYDALPESVQEPLDAFGITSPEADALLALSMEELFSLIWETVADTATAPIKLFAAGVGLALLCALITQLGGSIREGAFRGMFDAAAVLFAAVLVLPAATSLFSVAASVLENTGGFLLAFIPVYGAVLTASGQPMQAAISEGALVAIAQVVSAVSSTVLVPLLTVYLALCIASALCPQLRMDGIADAAKSIVTGAASVLMTVFTAVLSLKGTLAQSSDSVTLRTAKFAAGALFPVVGGAVSDALSSVQGSMSLIRAGVGSFASIALLLLLLPPIVSLLLHQLALNGAAAVAKLLQADRLAALYKSVASALSLLCALMAVAGVLLFITLGVLMKTAGG